MLAVQRTQHAIRKIGAGYRHPKCIDGFDCFFDILSASRIVSERTSNLLLRAIVNAAIEHRIDQRLGDPTRRIVITRKTRDAHRQTSSTRVPSGLPSFFCSWNT